MGERQFEGVSDLVDLGAKTSDVVPGDIRGLGDDELLDTGALDQGGGDAGTRIRGQGVTGREGFGVQMARQVDNTACPSPGRDQGAGGAGDRGGQDLLQSHGLAGVRGR